jgi:hypothetical protein
MLGGLTRPLPTVPFADPLSCTTPGRVPHYITSWTTFAGPGVFRNRLLDSKGVQDSHGIK